MTKLSKREKDKLQTDFSALIFRLNFPNPTAEDIKLWKKWLEGNPDYIDKKFSKSIDAVEKELTSGSYLSTEIAKNEVRQMRDNLGYADATEIERLLIKQVCVNWLRLNFLSKTVLHKFKQSHTTETGIYFDKLLNSAQNRFNRTMETFAKVKKLLADAELKKANAKIKVLRAEQMERKLLPAVETETDYVDAEVLEK